MTDKDRTAMGLIFSNLILSKGGVYDRITLEKPENLVIKTKTATGLVHCPHSEKLDEDYFRRLFKYCAFAKINMDNDDDEWELAEIREAPIGYIVVLNITDNLDGKLAEMDYTVTVGLQGKVRLNLTKRSKTSKGADARRDEAAKLVKEQAKISARLAQLQEEEDKVSIDIDQVAAALEDNEVLAEDGAVVAMEEDGAGTGTVCLLTGSLAPAAAATASTTASTAAGTSTAAGAPTAAAEGPGTTAAKTIWAEEMEAQLEKAASGQSGAAQ